MSDILRRNATREEELQDIAIKLFDQIVGEHAKYPLTPGEQLSVVAYLLGSVLAVHELGNADTTSVLRQMMTNSANFAEQLKQAVADSKETRQ